MPQFKPVPYKGEKKSGRFSKEEYDFIKDNIRTLGLRQTARKLRRNEAAVKKSALELGIKIDDTFTDLQVTYQQIEGTLRQSPEFRQLRAEFTKRELKYFCHRYAKHLSQFREDVTTTEETQIFQLIRYEIIMQRISSDVKSGMRDKKRLELLLQRFWQKHEGKDVDEAAMNILRDLENNLSAIRAAEMSKSTEYNKCHERQASIVKDLKATRDQRLARVESSKDDIVGLIKALQDDKFRQSENEQLQLVKLAVEREAKRLASEHKFVDGQSDLPVLTAETVAEFNRREDAIDENERALLATQIEAELPKETE